MTGQKKPVRATDPTSRDDTSTVTDNLRAIVKAYDIRGLADTQLGENEAFTLGRGFATWLDGRGARRDVVVGRDCRTSGPRLAAAFIDGLLAGGSKVTDIGLASTDMIYAASGDLGAAGAMITASHNPAPYNGFKLTGPGAEPVSRDHGLDAIVALGIGERRRPVRPGGTLDTMDYLDRFVDLVVERVDTSRLDGMRIVADTANGMGGLIVPAFAQRLGLTATILYGELDGTFPNHPADPLNAENLVDLQTAVVRAGADVGLAFDGDADRVFLVDDAGRPVSGSTTTAIVAADQLARHPGARILHNLICSRAVPETILELGGIAHRTPVGHSLIKAIMGETGAVFGGEHSAHYYFRSFWRADSGILAALTALSLLRDGKLSELRTRYDRYATSGERNLTVASTTDALETVASSFPGADRLDGVSFDQGSWWGNVRASNTEPLLRVNIEGCDGDAVDRGVATIEEIVTTRSA